MSIPSIPDSERCEVEVSDGARSMRFHRCRNRAKGGYGGKRMCGVHLRQMKEREQKAEAFEQQMDADDAHHAYLTDLSKRYGINIDADYHYKRGYSYTDVVVSLDDLLKLLGEAK